MDEEKIKLNIFSECKKAKLPFWQCPPCLFTILALILVFFIIYIASVFILDIVTAVLIVAFTAALLITFGAGIVTNFNRVSKENRMKTEFISIASHHLKAPLSNFRWTLEALKKSLKDSESFENISNSIEDLYKTSGKMLYIVRSLLDLTRIEVGMLSLKTDTFSLSELTQEELDSFKAVIENKNVEFDFQAASDLPKVTADSEHISMVMQNLIDNAIRYTPGGEAISISIAVEKTGNKYLRWVISHRGKAIPKEQQRYIFEKFFHAYTKDEETPSGSGIGLYIAKMTIQMSGGEIGFNSEEGKTTNFWFTLPISNIQKE